MGASSNPDAVSRRRVLAGFAALGATSVAIDAPPVRARSTTDDDAAALEPAGRLDLRGVAEAVVDEDGTTVYCSLVDGFGVVDASGPANPTVLYEERELTYEGSDPMDNVMDVKVDGDRLLVSGPNGFGEGLSGFFLYDVSDPANPERVAFHDTEFGRHNSFIDGEHVYLTGTHEPGSPTVIYDVANDDPREVARWSVTDADDAWAQVSGNYRQTHDVYVQDDTLYVAYWDAGTWLVDVSDPANPTAQTRLGGHDPEYLADLDQLAPEFRELPGNSHYVQPSPDGDAVFVGKEAWDAEETDHDGGPGGIECWDFSGSDPALRTVLRPPEPGPDEGGEDEDVQWTSHNFGIDGDRLYTSWYGGGVRVYDVSDLANPSLLGEWRDPETTAFWTAKPLDSGFVGASYADPRNSREARGDGEGARLSVFPGLDGEGAEPAPTMERRESPDPEDAGADGGAGTTTTDPGTTTGTDDAGATTTEPGTTEPGTTEPGTTGLEDGQTENGESTADGGGAPDGDGSGRTPGFGVLTALAGGGLGLWRLLERDDGY